VLTSNPHDVRELARKWALPEPLVKNVIQREGPRRTDVETYLKRMN